MMVMMRDPLSVLYGNVWQVLGPQNKATTFSSTPSLFFTLPLNIIAARNHTSATFNIWGEEGDAYQVSGDNNLSLIPLLVVVQDEM